MKKADFTFNDKFVSLANGMKNCWNGSAENLIQNYLT
jgi:hypothetical protein